jgi:hypothetical protein
MMFLTAEELVQLTGYKRPSCQLTWLKRARLPHFVSRGGRPVVLRSELEDRRIAPNGPQTHQRLRLAATGIPPRR